MENSFSSPEPDDFLINERDLGERPRDNHSYLEEMFYASSPRGGVSIRGIIERYKENPTQELLDELQIPSTIQSGVKTIEEVMEFRERNPFIDKALTPFDVNWAMGLAFMEAAVYPRLYLGQFNTENGRAESKWRITMVRDGEGELPSSELDEYALQNRLKQEFSENFQIIKEEENYYLIPTFIKPEEST